MKPKPQAPIQAAHPEFEDRVDNADFEIKPFVPAKFVELEAGQAPQTMEGDNAADSSLDLPVPQTTMRYREPTRIEKQQHRRRIAVMSLFVTVLLLTISGFFGLKYSKKMQNLTQKQLESLKDFSEKSEFVKQLKPTLLSLESKLLSWNAPGSENSASKAWHEMNCQFLIQEALTRKLNNTLDDEGRYLLIGCQLAQDMPQIALRYATEVYSETGGLQPSFSSWQGVKEHLIINEARFRLHALEVQGFRSFSACRQWKASPDCMIRYVEQARQPLLNKQEPAFKLLQKALPSDEQRLKVWLGWAGGLNAIKMGLASEAERRLQEAQSLLSKVYDPFLEREVFRSRIRHAWYLKDPGLMRRVWKQRPIEPMKTDPLAYLDTELMHAQLLDPANGLQQLDHFLVQPESFQRYRDDPQFIQWIVEQTIRNQRVENGQKYLERLIQTNNEATSKPLAEWLEMLRIRLYLAQDKGLEAMKILHGIERYVQNSSALHHLKGLAFLQTFNSKEYTLKAAQEFQKAINAGAAGESYFALIIAFLEVKMVIKAEATLSYWQRDKAVDKAWAGLARGLIRYREGDLAAAQKTWRDLQVQYPEFEVLRKLEQNLREEPKYLENQLFKTLKTMLNPDSPLGPLIFLRQ